MRNCASIRHPATRAVFLIALLLTAMSVRAQTLTPVKLRLSGKEIALKTPAVTDGHEVYLPLDALHAFDVRYTLTHHDETAALTFKDGATADVALARPGKQLMLPLSALLKPLNAEFSVNHDRCDIHLKSARGSDAGDREPAHPAKKNDPASDTNKQEIGVQQSQSLDDTGTGHPTAHVPTSPGTGAKSDNTKAEPRKQDATPPDSETKETKETATGPLQHADKLDSPPPSAPPTNVPQTNGTQTNSDPAVSPTPPPAKPAPIAARIEDVVFEKVDDLHARIRIAKTGKTAVSAQFLQGPSHLALDIANSTLVTSQNDWTVDHPSISAIHAMPGTSPNSTRLVLDLSRLVRYRIQQDEDGDLTVELSPLRGMGRKLSDLTVVVDPGHGGGSGLNPQGCSAYVNGHCIYEKNLTLSIGKKLQKLLEDAGVNVLMTRTRDVSVPLESRPKLANDNNADLFVSIHIDDCDLPNAASGTTSYYHKDSADSRALAQSLVGRVGRVSGLPNRGARLDSVLYSTGLGVLRENRVPATLVEIGYINNARDRAKLIDEAFQQKVAQALFDGIRGYIEGALPEETLGSMDSR